MLLGHNVGRATVVNAAVYRSTLHFLLRALLLGPFTSWNRYKGRGGGVQMNIGYFSGWVGG